MDTCLGRGTRSESLPSHSPSHRKRKKEAAVNTIFGIELLTIPNAPCVVKLLLISAQIVKSRICLFQTIVFFALIHVHCILHVSA